MILTVKNGKKDKIHIYLDGEYTATASAGFWAACGFSNGDDISESEWLELSDRLHFSRMHSRALSLLAVRDHSRRELVDKLAAKFSADSPDKSLIREQAENVCDKLEEQGYLNDERFARLYADELIRNKHLGPQGLRAALAAKGVSRQLADIVAEDAEIDTAAALSELLRTKFKNRNLEDEHQRSRTFAALVRLGYSYSDIKAAIYARIDECEE